MTGERAPRRWTDADCADHREHMAGDDAVTVVAFRSMTTHTDMIQIERLSARYVWWRPAADAQRDPSTLLRQVMALGTFDDAHAALRICGRDAFVAALRSAPPGIIDPRSWNYWHVMLDLPSAPPPPRTYE